MPWFGPTGVVDYAAATGPSAEESQQGDRDDAGLELSYGDPLIVRPELNAVLYRVGSLLHVAPIRDGHVEFDEARMVDWATAGPRLEQFRVIEHNLTECSPLPTLDPSLHVVQVEATGRITLSHLVADTDGSPVIGPVTHHYAPYLIDEEQEDAARHGLPAIAGLWQERMGAKGDQGGWEIAPPSQALTLAAAGFTVIGAAAERPGLDAAFRFHAGQQWVPGWYGGTRLLALARFRRGTVVRDLDYDYHEPGSRPVTVFDDPDVYVMRGPTDVETRPHGESVNLRIAVSHWAQSTFVEAGKVAIQEPVLIEGSLPAVDHLVTWAANCRRCGVPLHSGAVGRYDFIPYVHDLHPDDWKDPCPAHPASDRRRPHAPVCRVIERPQEETPGLPAEDLVVPF
ncbi:hypothetical protein NQK81_01200 [Amycolatopsis roodepoortensis]|uniref:hypothetical protein n=1 Tax=Amycolatopsis roodepoortensis TaxID=700274 RepID=UPI00214B898F|nr:hypothetical protein [Amycolatopsis roodepoortensis]UUV32091.1 hypothetical protein NQK81_01200 [Amycolatopsis roodepoortensis]